MNWIICNSVRIFSLVLRYNGFTSEQLERTFEGKEVKAMLYAPKEKGQGLVEYALIIALIAILLIVALGWVTGGLQSVFSTIASYL